MNETQRCSSQAEAVVQRRNPITKPAFIGSAIKRSLIESVRLPGVAFEVECENPVVELHALDIVQRIGAIAADQGADTARRHLE